MTSNVDSGPELYEENDGRTDYPPNQVAQAPPEIRDRNVYADRGGTVTDVGWHDPNNRRRGLGYRIIIDTGNGWDTYGHMQEDGVAVNVGDTVAQGQHLGQYFLDGPNGVATAPHVHLQRHDAGGNPIDPGDVNIVGIGGIRTSRFGWRWHPVFQDMRHHDGVDYVGPLRSEP